MLWFVAFHIIAVVAWFAGLFYLPRLFVYHTQALREEDVRGDTRFKIMERKLFRYIMTPAGIVATLLGVAIMFFKLEYYALQGWMHTKLTLVLFLWAYHLYCGRLVGQFSRGMNKHSETFYRFFNEVPTLILIGVVILVIIKPF